MTFVLNIPPVVLDIVQQGLLERSFHDALYPALKFRAEATAEEWPANTGVEIVMTRPGLLTPVSTPLVPGKDPVPQSVNYEQWVARLARYGGTIDTHMPTSNVASGNIFLRNIQQLGLQAGQSLNRLPRNALFQAYLSGQTALVDAVLAGATTIHVASLNGFTDVVVLGTYSKPVPVSPSAPLPVFIGTGAAKISRNVIGFTPDNADDPLGPGWLVISVAIPGGGFAARSPVISSAAPKIIRTGGGDTVDALGTSDTLLLSNIINASNWLRRQNVQPHEDGYFHAHIGPMSNAQIFEDTAFKQLNTSLPDGIMYKEGFIGTIGGVMFFENTETPEAINAGTRTLTGTNAYYSQDIGAETTNDAGLDVGRVIVTGRNALYERYMDENSYVSEAGVNGKVGDFNIVQSGVSVNTDRIRLTIRAPMDRLQDMVSATWSATTCFPVPSDVSSGGPERFKRAVVIEHVL